MIKFSFVILSIALLGSSVFAAPPNPSDANPEQVSTFIRESEDMITSVYRRAIAQAVDTKVNELKTAINTGENVVPAAIDILKLTLLSNPTQQTIRKTAEHIINIMSPEVRKLMFSLRPNNEETTQAAAELDVKPTETSPKKEIPSKHPNLLQKSI